MPRVELGQQVELLAPVLSRVSGWQLQVVDRSVLDPRGLISRGQKAGVPTRPLAWLAGVCAGEHHDEARQIAILAAKAVVDPRAQARSLAGLRPGECDV